MSDIKLKPKETIKNLNKTITQVHKLQNNLIIAKEKINRNIEKEQNESPED